MSFLCPVCALVFHLMSQQLGCWEFSIVGISRNNAAHLVPCSASALQIISAKLSLLQLNDYLEGGRNATQGLFGVRAGSATSASPYSRKRGPV